MNGVVELQRSFVLTAILSILSIVYSFLCPRAYAVEVDIQQDWVHIGDTTNSNWTNFGGDAPVGPSWSKDFTVPSTPFSIATLIYDIRDAELTTNEIRINGNLVGNPAQSPAGQVLLAQTLPVNPSYLQVGQNTLLITLDNLPGGDLDDIGVARVSLQLVPEPATGTLLALSGIALLLRRRKIG